MSRTVTFVKKVPKESSVQVEAVGAEKGKIPQEEEVEVEAGKKSEETAEVGPRRSARTKKGNQVQVLEAGEREEM